MRPEDTKSKPKRWAYGDRTWKLADAKVNGLALFCVTSSGSVSSFNDEDYEVDENSDEEEQEEPGDYIKG